MRDHLNLRVYRVHVPLFFATLISIPRLAFEQSSSPFNQNKLFVLGKEFLTLLIMLNNMYAYLIDLRAKFIRTM